MDPSQDTQPDHRLDPSPADEPTPQDPAKESLGPWFARNGVYVVAVLALFLWFCIAHDFDPWEIFALVKVIVGLGLVIFIHELGHFLVAKWCDVHVETFSIGFGPPIPGCVFRRGETTYMIALFPLGGYVKMVGEGPEEEAEDDPRSFKNKPVWQRMAIISAGVTMNVALAFVFFVYVFLTHGATRLPGTIGRVEAGSPAWVEGMRAGDVIYWFGNKGPRPYFGEIQPVTMASQKDEPIKVVFGPPGLPEDKWTSQTIVARKDAEDPKPVIGILPVYELILFPKKTRTRHELPVIYNSSAAKAEPPFQFDDAIIGTTDPHHPDDLDRVEPLPPDPRFRHDDPTHLDYFEFRRRLHQLAGKPMIVQVRRDDLSEPINIHVPAAFYRTLGLRMPMGRITAVRKDSPAAKELNLDHFDYYIEQLEIADASGKNPIRYPEKVNDPLRLPDELDRWASGHAGEKTVTLVVTQREINAPAPQSDPGNHPAQKKITLHLPWQEGRMQSQEEPLSLNDPLTIEGLGIAYRVNTTIEAVEPNSPAGAKGIKKDDKIVAVRWYVAGKKAGDETKLQKEWIELKPDQWAAVFTKLQGWQFWDVPKLDLRIERDGGKEEITLEAAPDETWPRDDRGLLLQVARQLQKADNFGQALAMGVNETWSFTSQIFLGLKAMATRRVSAGGIMGPIGIAQTAFGLAGEDFDQFLIFLGIIGINLAVINFLPIPVLDGGHMVFLLYEWVRGKPAPEAVRIAATYVGLAFIACLMILVIYLDVKRVL